MAVKYSIPFNSPFYLGEELERIKEAVLSGSISGNGSFSNRCEKILSTLISEGRAQVIMTPSCTHALEMCALLLNLGPGDEVIMPSFTFVSCATALSFLGAKIVFADVDPTTLNIDPNSLKSLITDRTKAILIVHYGGVACNMEPILRMAQERNIALIEDNAHGLGASYRGKPLGSFGTFATLSFHETKNITCGEGGALIINDNQYYERACILRDKGTNRSAFTRGDAEFYTWVDRGSSFVLSDVLAAFLYPQLTQIDMVNQKRRDIWSQYAKGLAPLRASEVIDFPIDTDLKESSAHLFFIVLRSKEIRDRLQLHLQYAGISAVFHYQPLHLSPFAIATLGTPARLPHSEDISQRLLRLPFYFSLSATDVENIINTVIEFFE